MEKYRKIYNMLSLLLFKIRWMRFQAEMRKYDSHLAQGAIRIQH
jgi:hypothetical protein